MHADRDATTGVAVVRERGRAVPRNPGTMLVPPDVAAGGGLSRTRNPGIARMMSLVGVGERAGSGFDARYQGADWAGLARPTVLESYAPDTVTLTFPLVAGEGDVGLPVAADERRSRVLAEADRVGSLRRSDVESLPGMGKATANGLLATLVGKGALRIDGVGRATTYRRA